MSTMSLGDEFQVTLASNVKSNARNKPADFETALAKPLELPGEWEVALIDLSYPHNWVSLDKPLFMAVLTDPTNDISEMMLDDDPTPNKQALYSAIISANGPRGMWMRRFFSITPGNYTVSDISKQIISYLKRFLKDIKNPTIQLTENTQRVTFIQESKYAIATFTENSILHIFGLDKQTTRVDVPGKPSAEYMVFNSSDEVESVQSPQLKRVTSMLVYSDIVELSLVGDTQAPLLESLPIQSKFGDQAYWSFNPPYYVCLREKQITTITIQLCDDTGETFPIADGKVLCRLNFRRVGMSR